MNTPPDSSASTSRVCLIVVGRTPLAAVLRTHRDADCIEVDSTFQALGTLDRVREHASESVGLVLGSVSPEVSDAEAMIGAIRQIDADAVVLAGVWESQWPAPLLDGVVEHADEVVSAVRRGRTKPARAGGKPAEDAPQSGAPSHPAPAAGQAKLPQFDRERRALELIAEVNTACMEALLHGEPVLEGALAALRSSAGLSGARFEEHPASVGHAVADDSVPLMLDTLVVGHLSLDGVERAVCVTVAETLAGWLALEAQHVQLRDAAFRDPDSGVWNRAGFDRLMQAALAGVLDTYGWVAVLRVELQRDDRETIDAAALAQIARALEHVAGENGFVGRTDHNELIAVIVSHTRSGDRAWSPPTLSSLASRLEHAAQLPSHAPLGRTIDAVLSMAVAPWDGGAETAAARARERARVGESHALRLTVASSPEM